MTEDATVAKNSAKKSIASTVRQNTEILSKLLLLATVIVLVAYSSKFILGLPQAKEYLASAFERRFDTQAHEGDLRWQVLFAIAALLLQMLVCAALAANFHRRVAALAEYTGTKIWYVATGAIVLALAWPYFSFAGSINGAYESVAKDLVGEDGISIGGAVDLATAKREILNPTWRYYFGAVVACGAIALIVFFANLRWPKVMSWFALALCVVTLALAAGFHVLATYSEPDLFRWVGAYALVFAGGAFIWACILLLFTYGISPGTQLVSLAVIGVLLFVKSWDIDPTAFVPYRESKLIQTSPCTPEATRFAQFDKKVLQQLELADALKLDELQQCQSGVAEARPPTQTARDYYEQKRQTRSLSASLRKVIKKEQSAGSRSIVADVKTSVGKLYERNAQTFFKIPSIDQKIDGWLKQRLPEIRDSSTDEPYRIFIASAQGGGLYAAYHAALSLARLQDGCQDFGRQLFAVSAVSGGSVGARLFSELIYRGIAPKDPNSASPAADTACGDQDGDGPYQQAVRRFFLTDYQAPLIGKLLFTDVPFMLLPRWFSRTNRASALDGAFESGMDRFWDRLGDFGLKARKDRPAPKTEQRYFFSDDAMMSNDAPATVVNASLANNGMPVILAPFYFSNFYDAPSIDSTSDQKNSWAFFRFAHLFDLAPGIDTPMMTGVLLGARFPYVVPGGRLPVKMETRKRLYKAHEIALADGGYFDNTGTATALAIALRLRERIKQHRENKLGPGEQRLDLGARLIKIELVRMVDSIRPGYIKMDASPNEVILPLATIYRARLFNRDFYGRLITGGVDAVYDVDFDPDDIGVSLSWQLSRSARKRIEKTIKISIARPVPAADGAITSMESSQPSAWAPKVQRSTPGTLLRNLEIQKKR